MSPSPTPPPSYSSRSSSKSSSSTKRKSSSTEKDKEKVKDKDNDKADRDANVKDRDTPPREGDDVFSIRSKSSGASSGTTSSTQSTVDLLRLMAGSGVRRSKCRAEFLEELAKGSGLAALDKDIAERLKIITGKEGIAFFRRFIGEESIKDGVEKKHSENGLSDAVVFAVCVIEAGRKVVDYYMTWRGKTRAKDIKGRDRRTDLLDDEFRRVARSIDREYRRVRLASPEDDKDNTHSHKSGRFQKRHQSPSQRERPPLPPNIVVSSPEAVVGTPSPATPATKRPSSANDSVISLPFLGAIRGVPPGNRLPLRVTNPDRNSVAVSSVVVPEEPDKQVSPNNTSLETLVETPESAENGGDAGRQNSVDTLVSDADQKYEKHEPSKETRRKEYSESISSAGSRSSRSSRSKRHRDRSLSRKRSPSKKHHESSSRSKSERKEHGHSSSRDKDKPEDGDRATRGHKHHHASRHPSRHRDERTEKNNDDGPSHKSLDRKRTTSSTKSISSNITLVVVDPDKVDQEMNKGVMRDESTWHGLLAPRRASKPSPATVVTPWTGPLARESDGRKHIPHGGHSYGPDDGSDDWVDVKGVSPKPESVIPLRARSVSYDSDSDSSLPPSPDPFTRHSPPVDAYGSSGSPNPVATPVYPRSNTVSSPSANPHGSPLPPANPYGHASPSTNIYNFSSPLVHHHGLTSPPTNAYSLSSPMSGGFSPGYMPSPPSLVSPNVLNAPLSSIHAISDSAMATSHGNRSPYLYSTPRPLASPYVPAWISPQSSVNVSLPLAGSITPNSVRGVPLHSGGYGPGSMAVPPY